MDNGERRPYDRRPSESEPAWQAFVAFRDLGPGRTVAAVGKALGKSGNLMDRWCQRWDWRARARSWDAALDSRRRADLAAQRLRATSDGLTAGGLLLARGNRLLDPPTGADPDEWMPYPRALTAAAGAMEKGVALQRLALGLPTSVTKQDATLRGEVLRVERLMDDVLLILEEELCDRCLPIVLARIRRLEEEIPG